MLQVTNLHVGINGTEILKGISLKVKKGEIHAIMGPNGSGKSTFSSVLAGHSSYEVLEGKLWFKGKDLLQMPVEKRAHEGLFLGFQYPVEIPGVNNAEFLRLAYNAKQLVRGKEELDPFDFDEILEDKMQFLGMDPKYKDRSLNAGFSGGEKKKNEILQMAVLEPELCILDETDSGLDIDALRIVAKGIKKLADNDRAMILITHYQRLLEYIEPDFVHVLSDGKIIRSGDKELAKELEKAGYEWLN